MASLKEAQEKVMKYQLLSERMKMLDNRRQLLISKILEINSTTQTIQDLEKDKESTIMLPLGSGVYVNGSVKNKDNLIVMLSRDIAIDMNIDKTKETLEKNKKTLENGLKIVEEDIIKIEQEMARLEPDVRAYFEKQQKIEKKHSDVDVRLS